MGISAISLGGLYNAEANFNAAARNLTKATDPNAGADAVDLSQAAVEMLTAKHQFEANLSVLKTADEIDGQIVNLLG